MNNFLLIPQGPGLFAVTSWPSALTGQKIKSKLLKAKPFVNFRYSLEHGKGDTEERGSLLPTFIIFFVTIFGNSLPLPSVTSFFNEPNLLKQNFEKKYTKYLPGSGKNFQRQKSKKIIWQRGLKFQKLQKY